MTRHREQPRRRGARPALFGLGGQVPRPEDFRSDPEPAVLEAGNLPVSEPGQPITEEERTAARAWLLSIGHDAKEADAADAVAAAIRWDRETAAEPYQIDVTREIDDTVRMGNNLSAAVRLELLADSMREEARDRGPGFPADYPTDPVDGAELDDDGLPVHHPVGDQCAVDGELWPCDEARGGMARGLDIIKSMPSQLAADGSYSSARWSTVADLQASVGTITYAAPRPTEEEKLRAELEPTPMEAVMRQVIDREKSVPRRLFTWSSRHDPKSLEFGVRQRLRAPAPLVDRAWAHGPILDQGTAPPLSLHDASGCTGHAGVNAANVLMAADRRDVADFELYDSGDAMRLYERAQELDQVPGEAYPGTSILALMKAGLEVGHWAGYLWAFGTRDIAQALLQVGPVIVGIPWLSGMTEPGSDGIVTVAGADLGGHALCLHAVRMSVAGRAGPWFGALQTWGETVGDGGVIWFHHRDLARLLHGTGEAAIPVPSADLL